MAESGSELFRQKIIDKMSSPDELTDCLKVTSPSVWAVLAAVVVLLAGLIAWACVGTLPTKADASVIVQGGTASVRIVDSYDIAAGMKLTVNTQDSQDPQERTIRPHRARRDRDPQSQRAQAQARAHVRYCHRL